MSESIPICTLTNTQALHRRQQVMVELWPLLESSVELADGYSFQFPGTETAVRQVHSFILMERACCPGLRIELVFEPENGPLQLKFRGVGVKEFIAHELSEFIGKGELGPLA